LNSEVIITGGAGFIGSNIISLLLRSNAIVHVFDNLSTGNMENISLEKVKFYKIDLKKDYKKWPKIKATVIYHLAANADVRGGIKDHNIDFNENLLVTKNVCDYALENNIENFVFSSSATVYGEPTVFPTPENCFSNQTSLYGASKLSCEAFIQAYSNYGYFKSTIFRFVSWIGKGYSHGVIYDFVRKLLNDSSRLEILGDGSQVKSYLNVADGVKGVLGIPSLHNEKSNIFNLGHDKKMNVKTLADIVCSEMDLKNVKYEYGLGKRGWIGDSPLVHLDTTKAKRYGWKPEISIEEGIRETVRYLISKNSRRFR